MRTIATEVGPVEILDETNPEEVRIRWNGHEQLLPLSHLHLLKPKPVLIAQFPGHIAYEKPGGEWVVLPLPVAKDVRPASVGDLYRPKRSRWA